MNASTFNDQFMYFLDMDEGIEAEMSVVLCSFWADIGDEIGAYGSIVDLRRAWMAPCPAKDALWAAAARKIIAVEMPEHALLFIKAFPLEYEGDANPKNRFFFNARQKAMLRYYGKLFDVVPFPGPAGRKGWLYAIAPRLVGHIDPPSRLTHGK